MIKIENVEVFGWNAAMRGMRNPMNSWDKSDSWNLKVGYKLGENDKTLAQKLADAGAVHAKYRRMINVTLDITAPLYWWKEFDTYKVGTVRNSCSTMHKICEKKFENDDFSHEHITGIWVPLYRQIISSLNIAREDYLETKDKGYWWQIIQLLPSSYNQRATVQLNYEVLANIYKWRKDHKLDEWRDFCKWIETLPYSELITGKLED